MKGYKATTKLAGMIDGDSFGGRFHALRMRTGLSRVKFGEMIGLTAAQLSNLEKGGKRTRGDEPTIAMVAAKCGVSSVWLYAGSVAPKNLWPDWWGQ